MKTEEQDKFIQGYVCAIACMTSIIGEHTNIQEALYSCIGNKSAAELIEVGVDEYDIEILKSVNYI